MFDIIDLDRFPLTEPGHPDWQALVARCRADLARDGMFNLEGFLHPEIAAQTSREMAPDFDTSSFLHERLHNVYFKDSVDGLEADHPALRKLTTSNRTLCADQLPVDPLIRLYEWQLFVDFLAATMDLPALHVMDDPLARINVMNYREGQALNWHFDRSEFTTTLLLQAPDAGGAFIYRTDLRSDDDPNYDGVAAMLRGEDPKVQELRLSPGTLNVFRGKNTPHRVSPVEGDAARIIAVFSYYERPGVTFSESERVGFFGRAG